MKIPKIQGFDQDALEKYVKNTGWLMIARVGSLGIKILVGFALANYLGASQLGILTYPTSFVTFFVAAAALGVDGFVTRELLRFPEKKNELMGTAFVLKVTGGLTIIPLIYFAYLVYSSVKPLETPFSYILILSFTGILQAFNIIDSYFQSRTQGKYIMTVQIAGNLISAATKLLLIILGAGLTWFVFALLFDVLLLAAGYLYIYQRNGGSILNWKFEGTIAKFLLRNSWPLAFSAVLVSIYMSIDKLMVEYYLGKAELGIYGTVVSLAESWYFIPVAIVTSVFPAIMNARRDDLVRYQRRMQNMYDLMVWISLSLAIFMTFAASLIYRIFLPKFLSGAPVLSIHIWAGIFVFLGSASGQFLIAEGYIKLSMMRTAMGAVVNIVLNIFWIPKYGIAGAAYATLIAYFVSTFWILLIPQTRQQGIMMLRSLFLITLFQKISARNSLQE
ncbi:flippase [Pedobacter metabolipauper]|uniref:O-antigen/teichoic acid export membrane protein n=1 Tax=Pedobacter metabolipauper TaxID=425513 RepID=A0A4R6SVN4_9SPHI|nr:flippase [Pedobacter metabolipauper]TDQ09850.1 O-antigen/teichoic acid export membrane protein [Pedobacter metabolipauper]